MMTIPIPQRRRGQGDRRTAPSWSCLLALVSALCLPCTSPCWCADSAAASGTPLFAAKLQHFVDDRVMAGAVMLVADTERIHLLEAVGYADIATKAAMTVDDVFWIASMTKPVTAAAFMMLVDEGKVHLDDQVAAYIPAFKEITVAQADGTLAPPSHPITIREILSHTSGLRFLNKKDQQKIDAVPLETSIANDLLEPLLSSPGTKYSYSNEGIDTAGRIIEIISGMPYQRFLQERLFTPLGMVDTTFQPTAEQLRRLAKSYKPTADKSGLEEVQIHYLTYPLDAPARYPAPGGGLFSTARDVCRFCQMLASGGTLAGRTYLSQDSVHQMTIKQTGPLVQNRYGFGLDGSGDGRSFGHGGAYKTSMNVSSGRITVFLVSQAGNWSHGDPFREFSQLAGALTLARP